MRWLLFALVSLLPVASSLQSSGVTRGGSGIQIGTSDRGTHSKSTGLSGGRGHSGVRLGDARFPNSTRQRPFTTTTSTTPPSIPKVTIAPHSADRNNSNTLRVSGISRMKIFSIVGTLDAVITVGICSPWIVIVDAQILTPKLQRMGSLASQRSFRDLRKLGEEAETNARWNFTVSGLSR